MKKAHYDTTTQKLLGWYDDDIHKTIPTPNVKVTNEAWGIAIEENANYVDVINKKVIYKDLRTLNESKQSKIESLNVDCGLEIIGGFKSNALGSYKWYQSKQNDQLNLIGVVTAGVDTVFKCGVEDADFATNGIIVWSYETHTVAQLAQILKDGASFKQVILAKFYTLKAQVESAGDEAGIEAVVW